MVGFLFKMIIDILYNRTPIGYTIQLHRATLKWFGISVKRWKIENSPMGSQYVSINSFTLAATVWPESQFKYRPSNLSSQFWVNVGCRQFYHIPIRLLFTPWAILHRLSAFHFYLRRKEGHRPYCVLVCPLLELRVLSIFRDFHATLIHRSHKAPGVP